MTNSRIETIRQALNNAEPGRDVRPAVEALHSLDRDLRRLRLIEETAQAYVDQPDPAQIQNLLDALDAE
jgi:hypothetical protein